MASSLSSLATASLAASASAYACSSSWWVTRRARISEGSGWTSDPHTGHGESSVSRAASSAIMPSNRSSRMRWACSRRSLAYSRAVSRCSRRSLTPAQSSASWAASDAAARCWSASARTSGSRPVASQAASRRAVTLS